MVRGSLPKWPVGCVACLQLTPKWLTAGEYFCGKKDGEDRYLGDKWVVGNTEFTCFSNGAVRASRMWHHILTYLCVSFRMCLR